LVGTVPPPDEYLYLGMFLASWDTGFLAHATLLTNELYGFDFSFMLLALALMELTLNPVPDSLTVADWDAISAAPLVDRVGFDLVNLDLTNSEWLMEHILQSPHSGAQYRVPVVVGGVPYRPYRHDTDEIIWNTGGFGMLYFLVREADILIHLDNVVRRDISRMSRYGFIINTEAPLRIGADGYTAAFGFIWSWAVRPMWFIFTSCRKSLILTMQLCWC